MTLKVYKDEYSAGQLDYIATRFEVTESNSAYMVISGQPEQLGNVMTTVNATEEQFKRTFTDYITPVQRKSYNRQAMEALKGHIQHVLSLMAANGEVDEDYIKLMEIYYKI